MFQTAKPADIVDLVQGDYEGRPFYQVYVKTNPRDAALRIGCPADKKPLIEKLSGQKFHADDDYDAVIEPFQMHMLVGASQRDGKTKLRILDVKAPQ